MNIFFYLAIKVKNKSSLIREEQKKSIKISEVKICMILQILIATNY